MSEDLVLNQENLDESQANFQFEFKEEINKQLQKINSKVRSTISTVHLGAIIFLLKSEFQEGIDSPEKWR